MMSYLPFFSLKATLLLSVISVPDPLTMTYMPFIKKVRDQTFYQIMLLDNISVLLENQLLRFLQNVLYIFIREHFEHRNLLHEFKRGWILLALIRLPCLELSYERPS